MGWPAMRLHVVRAIIGYWIMLHGVRSVTAQEVEPAPPQYYAPAPPQYYAPAPPLAVVDPAELEARGHHKKLVGALLMGIGAGLTVVGLGFAIDGAAHSHCSGHEEHATCTPSAATTEAELGDLAAAAGTIMAIAGIPVYVVGGAQVAKARRLAALSVQPLLSNGGGGAVARVSLRF